MQSKYQPPYTITPDMLNLVAEISEQLGSWSAKNSQLSPQLRRDNRIRTIQASLAIEQNSLIASKNTTRCWVSQIEILIARRSLNLC